ncbi:MAG: radical SAM protein [Candidatus Nezhaarchaeales archaeon]
MKLEVLRPDSILVWRNEEVLHRLSWYYQVMRNMKPAKYLICKKLEFKGDLSGLTEELWEQHDKLHELLLDIQRKIAEGNLNLESLPTPKQSFLDLKIELVKRMLMNCCFCERRCGVNRLKGEKGFCRLNTETRVATWFHHYGEEAPLVPSGTIFFTSCNFKCQFCQNWDISTNPKNGVEVSSRELAAIAKILRDEGCRNINYVGGEPTPNLHTIVESLKHMDVNVPLLWNSNMYCSLETMKILKDLIDIWLPDFKYFNDRCAERLSKVPNYFAVVSRNHVIAHESGNMIIRHLVLPNHLECCTKPLLKWIAKNLPNALVNIMEQYRPEHVVAKHPELYPDIARRPTKTEMSEAYSLANELGIVWEAVS